jgi:hypothetical protein
MRILGVVLCGCINALVRFDRKIKKKKLYTPMVNSLESGKMNRFDTLDVLMIKLILLEEVMTLIKIDPLPDCQLQSLVCGRSE